MALGLLKNQTPAIAVDFGVSALKVLQIAPGNPPTIMAAAMAETPANLVLKPAERLVFQASTLPELISKGDFKGKRTLCSVSAVQTFVQHLRVQLIPGTPVQHLLGEKLQELTGRDPSQFILRFIDVCEVAYNGAKLNEVLCIAMPRESVLTHMKAIRAAKLEPVGVHTEHVALVRSLDQIHRRAGDRTLTTMLVDIGYATTKVAVCHGREPMYSKTIQAGGLQFDKAAARAYGCSFKEARQRRAAHVAEITNPKRNGQPAMAGAAVADVNDPDAAVFQMQGEDGSTSIHADRRSEDGPRNLTELSEQNAPVVEAGATATDLMEAFTDEVMLCVRYHARLFPDRPIDRLVFAGGEASRTDLCTMIADATGIPAKVADPLSILTTTRSTKAVGLDLEQPAPGWATALGLCNAPTDL